MYVSIYFYIPQPLPLLRLLLIYFCFLQWLVEYNAALASVCFMILLGFVDDVLDVPWRVYVLFI